MLHYVNLEFLLMIELLSTAITTKRLPDDRAALKVVEFVPEQRVLVHEREEASRASIYPTVVLGHVAGHVQP